jgi:tRNA threonylcarbamoyladenosine biosynthesis protein TsaB
LAKILLIETSLDFCSVAIAEDQKILAIRTSTSEREHASILAIYIDEVMKDAGITYNHLDAVAVSKGPGSYTGLRIGVATAKGICYAANKPLIAINTLLCMASQFKLAYSVDDSVVLTPMIDARRMEVYMASYSYELQTLDSTKAEILTEESLPVLSGKKRVIFGDGAEKCLALYSQRNDIVYESNFKHSAEGMSNLASELYNQKEFVDLAYFEPFYLKEFVSTASK